jgi:hypothetical protein
MDTSHKMLSFDDGRMFLSFVNTRAKREQQTVYFQNDTLNMNRLLHDPNYEASFDIRPSKPKGANST